MPDLETRNPTLDSVSATVQALAESPFVPEAAERAVVGLLAVIRDQDARIRRLEVAVAGLDEGRAL